MSCPFFTCVLKSAASLEIVPETCDPTCTEVTALMVPVASTWARMSPRCTVTVWYATFESAPLRSTKITTAAMTIRTAITIYFFDLTVPSNLE